MGSRIAPVTLRWFLLIGFRYGLGLRFGPPAIT